ncbi:MAG: hypothetical protein A2527_05865 [Candidatus Lambdaproteobacteria bacterium RIFOXYD2_FULL_50_16]|uniref:Abasic site processing protein n=1 Tax=Candidatus Lambdaproteobacteria bacterium RIFOXYD2_FULL_50_16 TaxID=1817772 RepID=A0A1F6G9D0_9PROT|nr:MAG: hypothetical protein A2527_05865 [Candidatus Lambdaproteobacteria bacterium RIFOXYD2_FULL_50_16]
MCGRFVFAATLEELNRLFPEVWIEGEIRPRYNLSPGGPILGIAGGPKGMKLGAFQWGLVPHWAKDKKLAYAMINARAETLTEKPAFREAFKKRRCAILASGFYEWQKSEVGKQPYFIGLQEYKLFAIAGLWERWSPPEGGPDLISASLITCQANKAVLPIHLRMPAILRPEEVQSWLWPDAPERAAQILKPFAGPMRIYPVSKAVNQAQNEGPELLIPLGEG